MEETSSEKTTEFQNSRNAKYLMQVNPNKVNWCMRSIKKMG